MRDFQIQTSTQRLVSHHWGPVYSKLVLFHKGYDLVCSIAFTVFKNLQNFDLHPQQLFQELSDQPFDQWHGSFFLGSLRSLWWTSLDISHKRWCELGLSEITLSHAQMVLLNFFRSLLNYLLVEFVFEFPVFCFQKPVGLQELPQSDDQYSLVKFLTNLKRYHWSTQPNSFLKWDRQFSFSDSNVFCQRFSSPEIPDPCLSSVEAELL